MNLWLKPRIRRVNSVHKKMRGGVVGMRRVTQARVICGALVTHVGVGWKRVVNFKLLAVGEHRVQHGARTWRLNGAVRHGL